MEAQEILSVIAQGLALSFIAWVLITLVLSQQSDGKFTSEEAAKVIVIVGFVFIMIVIAYSEKPPFNETMLLINLGALLGLAGIDVYKAKKLKE